MRTLYLASNNRHKLDELAAMLGPRFRVLLARDLDPATSWDESGATFEANARIKAMVVRRQLEARGLSAAVLADDSGLEVLALGGAPGVISSRYAGKDGDDVANNRKLLKDLEGVPAARRAARFVCVLCFVDEEGVESYFRGTCEGRIVENTDAARGEHGFGYDPLFLVGEGGRTLAEMTADEKNGVSHRRHAVEGLRNALTEG